MAVGPAMPTWRAAEPWLGAASAHVPIFLVLFPGALR